MEDHQENERVADLFLSHSSKDKGLVEQLAEGLLEEKGLHSWIDIWAIKAASDWEAEINDALAKCRACLVILGPNGWGPYHLGEAKLAVARQKQDGNFVVVPVLLPGAKAEDLKVLGELFERSQRVEYTPGDRETETLQRIASALGQEAPFPLGRPRLSPYVIRRDARRWEHSGPSANRDRSIVYRGGVLERAQALAERFPGQLDAITLDFLRAGETARTSRFRRLFVASIGISGVLLVLLVSALLLQQRLSERTREARASGLGNLAKVLRSEDPTRALRVAEVAYLLDPNSAVARQALLALFYEETHLSSFSREHAITTLEVSFDGQRLATGGYGPNVQISNLDGQEILELGGQYRHVMDVAFSPDGTLLLVGSYNLGAHLYSTNGEFLRAIGAPDEKVTGVSFSPDGQSLLTASIDGRVDRWSLDGELLNAFTSPTTFSNAQVVDVSDDGSRVLVGYFGGDTVIWNIDGSLRGTLEPSRNMRTHQRRGAVRGLAYLPEFGWIITGHNDGTVLIWNEPDSTTSERTEPLYEIAAHSEAIWDVSISPGGAAFATTSSDGTVRIWPLPYSTSVEGPLDTLRGHTNWAQTSAFTPDASKLITGGQDGVIRTYYLNRDWPQRLDVDNRRSVQSTSGIVAERYQETKIHIRSARGDLLHELDTDTDITALCYLPAPRGLFVAGEYSGRLSAWTEDGEELFVIDSQMDTGPSGTATVNGLACSPLGDRFAVASGGYFHGPQQIEVRDAAGTLLRWWRSNAARVAGVSFSADGEILVGGNGVITDPSATRPAPGFAVHRYDRKYDITRVFTGHAGQVNAIDQLSDTILVGFGLANLPGDNGLRLWDKSGNLLFEAETNDPVTEVGLLRDESHFTIMEDNAQQLWLTARGIVEWLASSEVDQLSLDERDSLRETGGFELVRDRASEPVAAGLGAE